VSDEGYKMTLVEQLRNIKTKNDFIDFIIALIEDFKLNPDSWENQDIVSYLEAMSAWIKDSDGLYKNTGEKLPKPSDWKVMARLLYAAKIYE
jgi:hypothetical protein